MKKTLLQLLWMSLAVCLSVNLCFAQSNGLGLQPYQIYDGARENINVGNGNLYLTLPLASLLGRDGHDLNVSMNYNSKAWVLKSYTPPQNGALPIYYWAVDPDAFWRLPLATTLHREPVTTGSVNPGRFELTCWKHYAVTLPDGSTHAFPNVQTNCWKRWCEGGNTVCGVGTGPAPEYDVHTGSTMDAPMLLHVDNNTVGANPPTISFPDGHKVTGCNGSGWNVEDANGNCIAISGVNIATGGFTNTTITDTVGRNLTVTSS